MGFCKDEKKYYFCEMTIRTILTSCILASTAHFASAQYFEADGIAYRLYASRGTVAVVPFEQSEDLRVYQGALSIPDEVEYDGVFYPVAGVSRDAFAGCDGLVSVILPSSLLFIDEFAFSYCSSLVSISFPESLGRIGEGAFVGCSSIETVSLPSNVVEIGDKVFYDCRELKEVSVSDHLIGIGDFSFSGCVSLSGFEIPDAVERIGSGAFRNCGKILEVSLPASLKKLGDAAFENCVSLGSVELKSSIKDIPAYCFNGCRSLENVSFIEGCKKIGAYAFQGCSGLREVYIGENIEEIGDNAFGLCTSLSRIDISETGSLIEIGSGAFTHTLLEKADLRRVAVIGADSFAGCGVLEDVVMYSMLDSIGSRAFHDCPELRYVTSMRLQPPALNSVGFDRTSYATVLLSVPESCAMLYRQTPPWSYFDELYAISGVGNIPGDDDDLIVKVTMRGVELLSAYGSYAIYDVSGRLIVEGEKKESGKEIALPSRGIYIVRSGQSVRKIVF